MNRFIKLNIIAVLCLGMFALIAYLTNYVGIFNNFDLKVVAFLNQIAIKYSTKIPELVTNMGDINIILVILLVISFLLACVKKYKEALFLNLSTNSAYLVCGFFKEFFKRLRPPLDYQLVQPLGYSFPSGHVLLAVCFYGMIIFILSKIIKNNSVKSSWSFLLVSLILLISFSRIYLGVHYFTDVLASLFLGGFILVFWINLYNIKAS